MYPELQGMKNTKAFEKEMHHRKKKDNVCTSTLYGYYGSSKSQENISFKKKVLSTVKSNYVDSRTFTNQMNVSHESLFKKRTETFISKNKNASKINSLCAVSSSMNHQVKVLCTPIITSKNNNDDRITKNVTRPHAQR